MVKQKEDSLIDKLSSILDILICLILFIMSLYKGGFYKEDTVFSNLIIEIFGVAIIVVKLVRNIKNNGVITRSILVSILDVLMIAMPICYLFPIIFKTYANLEGSITELLTYTNFSIIYFITRSTKNKEYYINTIILIGVVLAILGIDELTTRQLENIISNISISYVVQSVGRLAATLQYANVTALILLLATQLIIYKLVKLEKAEVNYYEKYKKIIYSFLIVLLDCAIILTNSRMAITILIISNILIGIYLSKHKLKKIVRLTSILIILSFFIINLIEKNIANVEYSLIIMIFGAIFILFFIIGFCINNSKVKKFLISVIKSLENRLEMKKIKKIINYTCVLLIMITVFLVIFINPALVIKSNKQSKNSQGRNIYSEYKSGENKIEITLKIAKDTKYNIYIYEVYQDFTRNTLLKQKDFYINKNNDETITLVSIANVSDKAKNLRMSVTVNNGSVNIKKLKINNQNIKLSYILIPDSFIFKLQDTFKHDQNNILRKEYYRDAIKLIKRSPIFGLGGEGFLARYQEVQTSNYISSEAHSSILQICVETGIIGGCVFIAILLVSVIILIKVITIKEDNSLIYILLVIFISYITTSIFDITMSFQLLVLILAIIIGVGTSEAFEELKIKGINLYKTDNKSIIAFIKICILTTSLMIVGYCTYYSYNVYRAEMINVYDKLDVNDIAEQLKESYKEIATYEKKLKYDKYNIEYAIKLSQLYAEHIKMVSRLIITEKQETIKTALQRNIIEYTIKQKNVIDNLIEYDYYNKYVLEVVAKDYFNNFLAYSNIYKDNFATIEIAYAFYLGYAIKLTERIEQMGPYNKVANEMVDEIYNTNYKSLSSKNSYIKSKVIESVLEDIKLKIDNRGD